jgi:hypothetical protein
MPEIFLKPRPDSVVRFFLAYYPPTNPFFQREVDCVSHWTRQFLTLFLLELDLFITLMASIGVFNASTSPAPNFIEIFLNPVTAGLAVLIFLAVPLIIIVTELIWEAILKRAEDRTKSPTENQILYIFFLVSTFGTFFALLSALIGMGLTGYDSAIQLAFVIWGLRLLINWTTVKPLWITGQFFGRKFFGKDRPADEPTVRRCPGILCCKSQEDEDKYLETQKNSQTNKNKEDV